MNLTHTIIDAHKHSSRHEPEIRQSKLCGCFHCDAIFSTSLITESMWLDEPELKEKNLTKGRTACCPYCGIDSVIGDASQYLISKEFLAAMRLHWFGE